MKPLFCLAAILLTAFTGPAEAVKLWNGKERGMELVTVGHKRVTVFLADGRTSVVGIPILVEQPKTGRPVSPDKSASPAIPHERHATPKP